MLKIKMNQIIKFGFQDNQRIKEKLKTLMKLN
jgi:hypothetical protein